MRTSIADYITAFNRHYPNYSVAVKYKRYQDKYAVVVNGEQGNLLFSMEDLIEATRAFNR